MKHIISMNIFEKIDYSEIHDYFYLVTNIDMIKKYDTINSGYLEDVIGVSDSPNIVNRWLDVRDILLIFPRKEFLLLNNDVIKKIDYFNYDGIMKIMHSYIVE